MTGIISAALAAFSVALLIAGTCVALAVNSVPLAIAVTGASFGAMGLFAAWVRLRRRFRYPRVRHGLRLAPPWEWQIAIAQIRGEARAAKPRWTRAELAALDDEASLEQLLGKLPEARRERRLR